MENLFTKAVTLTDIHFGRRANSAEANQDNLDFIDWFCEQAKSFGADTCIMMGDWHDNRNTISVSTLDYSLRGVEKLNAAFKKVIWIPGNHDLFYRDRRDIASIAFAQHLPNVQIIRDPITIGGVTLLPWLVGNEAKTLRLEKSRYVFGHLEIGGYLMNEKVPMPTHEGSPETEDFAGPDYVLTGHFHFRQNKKNVIYTGNVFPFDFADAGDEDRGMMLLEWGKQPEFRAWPAQPLFKTYLLSDLLAAPAGEIRKDATFRVSMDMDLNFEEAQNLRDRMSSDHGLRKLELIPMAKKPLVVVSEDFDISEGQTVDQIVIQSLLSVDSNGLDPARLVAIYNDLKGLG